MNGRNDRIYAEAAALWRALRNEPPPRDADPSRMLDMVLGAQPPATYDRLASPHLRACNIAFPRR